MAYWECSRPGLHQGCLSLSVFSTVWLHLGVMTWRRKWQPTPVLLPREFRGQKSLVGYRLWGHKQSDTTEWLTHTLWKPVWKFLRNYKQNYHMTQPLLNMLLKPQNTNSKRYMHPIFKAALFTIAKTWKQHSVGYRKCESVYIMEYSVVSDSLQPYGL